MAETGNGGYVDSEAVGATKMLAAELCKQFYGLGWVSGTGGSITIKAHDPALPKSEQLIVMAPSGVQKERMLAEDMYVLSAKGSVLSAPLPKPVPHKPPKCSECAPLFLKAYQMRNAGAVIHSHGLESCLATMIHPFSKEFRITHMEMIKGIQGHAYRDELVVPIIENTPHEYELTDSLAEAIAAYPKTTAVLVRNHGIYIWGDSWISAKTQAECYHYLFDAAFKLYQMGLDPSTPDHGPISKRMQSLVPGETQQNCVIPRALKEYGGTESSYRCILLDIEGTTTPISFVSDVLFPYARNNVGSHLRETYDTEETQADIKLLRMQVDEDLKQGVGGAQPIPSAEAGKDEVINAVEANVSSMISADRKITALKQLQGHIWRTGYARHELQGELFEDVPTALSKWHAAGIKVYIYSSGSREAQRLIFGNTKYGDLRKYLCGFFDTTTGNKRESRSYSEICQSVGVDHPSQVLFATDVLQEAVAAQNAGLQVVLSVRPGNASLPPDHGFHVVNSLLEI
ncbi:hypothetical protein SUGI_0067000 [Cryptomeria japonica]|uniref:probable bifunctional methylthioribulose-1-phosphate dehydratase/enolase-phosphatase E1 n=1 Tax=Cryptomeria japonica TaxID=3369 RepID=UPI002408D9EF|nr:probable bifunctional methylthioribulose-1-phosphate dehydratase/enolase-phosphatase E1 [Cryptomeria japonica]GLJ07432.1 hypothetical protein SUGI_0067000 [Cryptomeria japonica]